MNLSEFSLEGSVIFKRGMRRGPKIAAFTFNGTLVISPTGNDIIAPLDSGEEDFVNTYDNTNDILEKLARGNYTIVIFESIFSSFSEPSAMIETTNRITSFLLPISANPYIYISTASDKNMIPSVEMWNMFLRDAGIRENEIERNDSFFCVNPTYVKLGTSKEFADEIKLNLIFSNTLFANDENPELYDLIVEANAIIIIAADETQFRPWLAKLLDKYQRFTEIKEDGKILELNYIDGSSYNYEEIELLALIEKVSERSSTPIVWIQIPGNDARVRLIEKVKNIVGDNVVILLSIEKAEYFRKNDLSLRHYFSNFEYPTPPCYTIFNDSP